MSGFGSDSKTVELTPLLVEQYRIKESERHNQTSCHMCTYIPAWLIKEYLVVEGQPTKGKALVGYACSEHVDTVLYLVGAGIVNEVPPPHLESDNV